jgi:anti-anti-sigma factor
MPVAQSWQQSRTAQFSARREAAGTVITVDGELDAANADQLVAYVQRNASRSQRVIVDLRGLEFIGASGFSALHRINVVCSAAQTPWAMATSAAVARLLRVCDPDGTLPVTSPADEPLLQSVTRVAGAARSALAQLVAESG